MGRGTPSQCHSKGDPGPSCRAYPTHQKETTMRASLICAWCGKSMGHAETSTGRPARGICDPCLLRFYGLTPEQLFSKTIPQHQHDYTESFIQGRLPPCGSKWT